MSHKISIATIQTNIPIDGNKLVPLKKALSTWLKKKGFEKHSWIHNHETEEDPAYEEQEYPFIQLRCPNKLLMLWGMNEGAKVLQEMMMSEMLRGFQYKGTQCHINPKLTGVKEYEIDFTPNNDKRLYEINYFVGLNSRNFKAWQKYPSASQRAERLQELLKNNMAMFCKAAGWWLEKEKLKLDIYWIWNTEWVNVYGDEALGFTISYRCNLELPDGLALGRGVRIGYGWQTQRKDKTEEAL